MAPRIACVVLLAVACVAHGPRWTAAQEAQALGAASSGERQGHTAAHAFDGSSSTYWLSKSPAAGQWLTYTFPMPQTVLQYSLSGSSDVRWVSADGLTAFEVQGSNDGVKWSYIDRRCVACSRAAQRRCFAVLTSHLRTTCSFDERLWQPGETRVYTVRAPPGGDAALKAYTSFRLSVAKTPGRRVDESYAGIGDWRFLTAESASSHTGI